jgi:hypothetical protein
MAKYEPLHIAAEVDVDNQLWSGIADYQGAPHLIVSEPQGLDQPRARRRQGQTFFLITISRREFREIFREWKASQPRHDGDPKWKQKQDRWEAVWGRFKRGVVEQVVSAWRVRGSFCESKPGSHLTDSVRWTLLRKTPVTGAQVRDRLLRIEQLVTDQRGPATVEGSGEELPF